MFSPKTLQDHKRSLPLSKCQVVFNQKTSFFGLDFFFFLMRIKVFFVTTKVFEFPILEFLGVATIGILRFGILAFGITFFLSSLENIHQKLSFSDNKILITTILVLSQRNCVTNIILYQTFFLYHKFFHHRIFLSP